MNVPGKTSPPSVEGLSFFCFFSFLKERKEGLNKKSSKASGSSFLTLMQDLSDFLIFFSCLDARKEAKEDQGVRDAGHIWPGTYLEANNLRDSGSSAILDVLGKTSPPSAEGLSFFCFFSFLKERKEGLIRKSSLASHVSENKRSPVEWTGDLLGLP